MKTTLIVKSDFMEIPSEIPLDENCPKCAFRLNGRCVKTVNICGFGRRGYYALRGRITEEITQYDEGA